MEELKALIDIVERKTKDASAIFLNPSEAYYLETKLYNVVRDNPDLTEEKVIEALYGSSEKGNAFKMLKSRVKKKLYNQLQFISLDSINMVSSKLAADIKCNTLINQAIILDRNQQQALSDKILSQALVIAKEVDNTTNVIRALEIRRENYCYHNPNQRLFKKVDEELQEYYVLQQYQAKAASLYQRCLLEIRISVEARYHYFESLKTSIDELYAMWVKTNSSTIYSYYYYVLTVYLELTGDYVKLVNTSIEQLVLLSTNKVNSKLFNILRIRFQLVYAYLKSKSLEEGLKEAEEVKRLLPIDSFNWFAHMENYFLLAVHSKKYTLARKLLDEVYSNKYFERTTVFSKERWELLARFFSLITGSETKKDYTDQFKYVPLDKAGLNLWSLYYDFIQALVAQDVDLFEREAERLRKYALKHVLPKEDERSRLFIKLLGLARKVGGDAILCRKKGRYLLTKLRQTPIAGDAHAETEIIPFEDLWEFLLHRLEAVK